MYPVLQTSVPIAVFFAFAVDRTPTEDYTPTQRKKAWADPNPVEALPGLGKAAYLVVATNPETGQPILKNGKPYLTTIYMELAEAAKRNVPPQTANAPGTAECEWPMPIDKARLDPDNYYLDLDTPFSGPMVHDKRAAQAAPVAPAAGGYTEDDRARDIRIEKMITLVLERGI